MTSYSPVRGLAVARNPSASGLAALDHLIAPFGDAIRELGAGSWLAKNPLQNIVDGMLGQVAVVNSDWQIIAANTAWIAEACQPHLKNRLGIGKNYKTFRKWTLKIGFPEAQRLLEGLTEMEEGRVFQVVHTYASTVLPGRHFYLSMNRFDVDDARYATISRLDVTELYGLRRQRLHFDEQLLQAQEDERHRVARDFHDSAAQFLVAMGLGLMKLQHTSADSESKTDARELSGLLDQFHQELRGLTYLLHPPELERGGLHAAVTTICQGFASRSGLQINLKYYGGADFGSSTVEATVYRIVQEALSNIHKHAQAKRVRVRLGAKDGFQYVVIYDDGVGLPESCHTSGNPGLGVGIPGMVVRVQELGGHLSVRNRRGRRGIIVAAVLPVTSGVYPVGE